jgi:hypothetical protein
MPLPASRQRTELHLRRIEIRGFQRVDGLYEIEGRVLDTKSQAISTYSGEEIAAGEPIHDMWVKLVVDEALMVKDIVAVTDASPYPVCREAVGAMKRIIGERIKPGWSAMVKQQLGGAQGCVHLMELLLPLATVAYQTLSAVRTQRLTDQPTVVPSGKVDSCYAYSSEGELVRKLWPASYTGPT